MSSISLVDCNNFFVSCERVFNPALLKKAVIVLSSNDGCIIARSAEAKALGVPMGGPLFQWRDFLERHGVVLLSSNFALYSDLSSRVMEILKEESSNIEIYSIDEAFVEIENPVALRKKILQWTGIPVSIGVAKTKTLAKVAGHLAKKSGGICTDPLPHLENFPIEDVWGIGRRLTTHFAKRGIFTVGQLLAIDDGSLNVTVKRTIWELKGIPSLPFSDEVVSKQSIMTSRTFGRPISSKNEMIEAVSSYATYGSEKLRSEGRCASWLQLSIETQSETLYSSITFTRPTDYTPEIITYALSCLDKIFIETRYRKAGILLGGLVDHIQDDLFSKPLDDKKRMAQSAMDRVNAKFGKQTLSFAVTGRDHEWRVKKSLCSPAYTTNWNEILNIKI